MVSILPSSATDVRPHCWSRAGRLVWWCFPRFDGDPVFCRLVAGGEEKGFADVVLDGMASYQSEYLRNTAIVMHGTDRQAKVARFESPILRRAFATTAACTGRRN